MKKILFTGATGFLGRNLLPVLSEKYDVFAPNRKELDLKDAEKLRDYIKEQQFDVIIHAAIPNIAFHPQDSPETLLKDSLSVFMNLYRLRDEYGKMIYFGSGAEFDKEYPISLVSEDEFGNRLPSSDYGLAKYIMNCLCRQSDNIYNLRIFGCYGPTDADFKLITYVIRCCLRDQSIHLRQNCLFDYMVVSDLLPILDYFICNMPSRHDFNVCTGIETELTEICRLIKKELNSQVPVSIEREGFNNPYSGDNSKIRQEIPDLRFTCLSDGIRKQINWEKEAQNNAKKSC